MSVVLVYHFVSIVRAKETPEGKHLSVSIFLCDLLFCFIQIEHTHPRQHRIQIGNIARIFIMFPKIKYMTSTQPTTTTLAKENTSDYIKDVVSPHPH